MEILVKAIASIADAVEVGEHLSGGGTAIVNLMSLCTIHWEDAIEILKDEAVKVPYQIGDGVYLFPGEGIKISDIL